STKIQLGKIGIDMGQTLSKIAYLDDATLNLSSFPTKTSIPVIKKFLNSKKGQFNNFSFTGGKSERSTEICSTKLYLGNQSS
ncbi:MAG: hypothetical protein ACFFDH_17205, partial [Promethearchaeota archaeon]